MTKTIAQLLLAPTLALFLSGAAHAAVPGITGPTFNLTAQPAFLNQPDGNAVYSWGYGCNGSPTGTAPKAMTVSCPSMQVPGPTLIVTEGQTVTVTLTTAGFCAITISVRTTSMPMLSGVLTTAEPRQQGQSW